MRPRGLVWLLAGGIALGANPAHAQSLRQLFLAGLATDPALASAEAQYEATAQRVRQARSVLLPSLAATGTTSTSRFYPDNSSRLRDFHNDRWTMQLSQPLYKPEAISALDEAKAELEAAHVQVDAAEADLAGRLASGYFDVLTAREVLLATQSEKKSTLQQLASARRSFELGTVAITDVRQAEAKYDLDIAQEIAAANDLAFKRDSFKQLIGDNDFELPVLPRNAPDPQLDGEELPLLIQEAVERNPLAVQTRLQFQLSQLAITKARQGHYPSLDLNLSYGSDRTNGTPVNPLPVHGNTAQGGVTLNVPLFSGLGADAKVQEAVALQEKARADLETSERNVATRVREAYYGVKSAHGQIASLETAERSTDASVRSSRRSYQVGMIATADVLKAESIYFQAHRDLMKAKLDVRLNRIKLQIALGRPWRESIDELARLAIPEHLVAGAEAGMPEGAKLSETLPKARGKQRQINSPLRLKLAEQLSAPGADKP